MKKFTSVILLVSFILAQYAKQCSYLECKLSNYFKNATEKCNCEKVLAGDPGHTDQSPLHNHVRIDESYFPPQKLNREIYSTGISTRYIVCADDVLEDGFYNKPDRPPQFD